MKTILKITIIIGLLGLLITGCNKEDLDRKNPANNTAPPVQNEPPKEEPGKEEPLPPADPNKIMTFKEAFPNEIFGNPIEFLQKLIPGFKIGLSKAATEKILGEPNIINSGQFEWGEKHDWVYENINGYQLTATFDQEGYLVNFQLNKYLSGKGLIPKVVNKKVPSAGEPVHYTELGFEGILLGTTVDEVLNRFGEPVRGYMSYDEMYGYNLAMVYQGITLHILLENDSPYVQFIETNDLGIIETYRGIYVGSPVEDIIKKYGSPAYDWKEIGDLIYATEDYWFAIKFIVDKGKVAAIYIYEAS